MFKLSTFVICVFAVVARQPQANGAEPMVFPAHEQQTWQLAYTPAGDLLASAGVGVEGEGVKLWDPKTQRLVRPLHLAKELVHAIDISRDGGLLVAGSWGTVRLWDIKTGEVAQTISLAGGVTGVALSPDGALAVAVRVDSPVVHVFDAKTGKPVTELTAPMDAPAAKSNGMARVCFSADGKLLVAACGGRGWPDFTGADSVLTVWDVPEWSVRASFAADRHNINALAISPDSSWIAASCHRSRVVKLYRTPPPHPVAAIDADTITKLVDQLDSEEFGEREGADLKLRRIGLAARAQLTKATLDGSAEQQFRARAILKAFVDAKVAPLHALTSKLDLQAVAFSHDGTLLATGSMVAQPNTLILWKLGGEKPQPIAVPSGKGAWSVAFSPDDKQLAQGSQDGSVTLWEIATLTAE